MESLKLFLGLLGAIISVTRLEYFVTPLKVAASPIVTAQKNVTPTKVEIAQAADITNLLKQGDTQFDAGDYSGAVAVYTRVIEQNPSLKNREVQIQARLRRARAYILGTVTGSKGLEDYDRSVGAAIADCSRVIQIEPQNSSGYACRGYAYLYLTSYQEAFEEYDKAIRLDSSNAKLYYERGSAYNLLGKSQEAIADFGRTIELNSNFADAYYSRGLARSQVGDKVGAIADLQRAVELFKSNYGENSSKNPQYRNAVETLRKLQE
jgi:tetratricopeptide (TPR) repeat protein